MKSKGGDKSKRMKQGWMQSIGGDAEGEKKSMRRRTKARKGKKTRKTLETH